MHLLFGEGVEAWRASAWATSIIAAMVIARSCADPQIRLVVLATLVAVLGPLLVKAAAELGWEHQAMVNTLGTLQAEGVDTSLSSPQLVARVQEPVIRAWMTTPNLLAGVLVAMVVVWLSLAVVAIRRGLDHGWWALCGAVGLLGAAGVVLTGSKAGILALVMVAGLTVVSVTPLKRIGSRWGGWLAVALVLAVPVVVVLRGMMGEEALGQERSALVRYHYLIGAAGAWWEQIVMGIGIGSFQEAYTHFRPLGATEEVQSTHNAIVDWIAMLGVAGVLWVIVFVNVVRRCGRALFAAASPHGEDSAVPWQRVVIITILGGIVLRFPWLPMGDLLSLTVECVAAAALVILALVVCQIAQGAVQRPIWIAAAIAAVAVAVLGQADMLFFAPATVGWVWMVLAAGGPTIIVCSHYRLEHRITGAVAAIFLGVGCIVTAQEATVTTGVMAHHAAIVAAAADPAPEKIAAGEALIAGGTWIAPRVLAATLLLESPSTRGRGVAALGQIATLDANHAIAASIAAGSGHDEELLDAVDAIVAADPNGLLSWWVWSRVMETMGRRDEAREGWVKVIEIDDAWQLDTLRRLPDAARQIVHDKAQ
jgi:hypothetical protein